MTPAPPPPHAVHPTPPTATPRTTPAPVPPAPDPTAALPAGTRGDPPGAGARPTPAPVPPAPEAPGTSPDDARSGPTRTGGPPVTGPRAASATGPRAAPATGTVGRDVPRPGVVGRIRRRAPRPPAAGGTPSLRRLIGEDLQAVLDRDPSCSGRLEALLHAGWQGLALHRLAHRHYASGRRLRAAALTRLARLLTGMEIHAGARIGRRAFIDHGFGVVIGETAVVGDDVTLYHGVTLGSRGWLRDSDSGRRRHPVVGDGVLIGTGASVLGPVTVGDGRRIAAHSLVLHDLPAPGALGRPAAAHPKSVHAERR